MYAMNASLPVDARRPHASRWFTARVAACLLAASLVGCGESDSSSAEGGSTGTDSPASAGSSKPSRKERKTVDPETVGSIWGVVIGTGTPPERKKISMGSAPYCVTSNEAAGGVLDDRILVANGRVQNAFVWVKSGLEDYEFEASSDPVELDQKGCMYTPRVIGLQRGQEVLVANSDQVMHNVHTHPKRNRAQNIAQVAGAPPRELDFKKEEVMVRVTCDVHAWMTGWIGIVDHPFFAVTGSDGGYRFDGLPPGTYTLGIWTEKLGEKEITVVLKAQGDVAAGKTAFEL
jgi:plastocyanin